MRSYLDRSVRAALRLCAAIFVGACVAVNPPISTSADAQERATQERGGQRPRAVVALMCDAERQLCQNLVRALSDAAPGPIYRINPAPVPSRAFVVDLTMDSAGAALLSWENGRGQAVSPDRAVVQDSHDSGEFARLIVKAAGPELPERLQRVSVP